MDAVNLALDEFDAFGGLLVLDSDAAIKLDDRDRVVVVPRKRCSPNLYAIFCIVVVSVRLLRAARSSVPALLPRRRRRRRRNLRPLRFTGRHKRLHAATLAVGGIDRFTAMLARMRNGSIAVGSQPASANACRTSSSLEGRPGRRGDFSGIAAI